MAGAAGEGGGAGPEGSRIPNNWQGLFRFCQEATRDEDAPGESMFVEMDPEVRNCQLIIIACLLIGNISMDAVGIGLVVEIV